MPTAAVIKCIRSGLREAIIESTSSPNDSPQIVTAVADFTIEYTDGR